MAHNTKGIGNRTCKCNADDMSTASDNYDAVTGFLQKFPELKKNEFFITGESYAGMSVSLPTSLPTSLFLKSFFKKLTAFVCASRILFWGVGGGGGDAAAN